MAIKFNFLKNDEPVALSLVDESICKYLGIPCSKERYSCEYQMLTWLGLELLIKHNSSTVQPEMVEDHIRNRRIYDKLADLARIYLAGEFTFSAWR